MWMNLGQRDKPRTNGYPCVVQFDSAYIPARISKIYLGALVISALCVMSYLHLAETGHDTLRAFRERHDAWFACVGIATALWSACIIYLIALPVSIIFSLHGSPVLLWGFWVPTLLV